MAGGPPCWSTDKGNAYYAYSNDKKADGHRLPSDINLRIFTTSACKLYPTTDKSENAVYREAQANE